VNQDVGCRVAMLGTDEVVVVGDEKEGVEEKARK
jgi:hypothetical protein